jgi:hypothetical protein
LHFHPDDAMTLRDLMRRVLDEPEVAAAMRAKGQSRPDMYRWDTTAAALMRGLQDLKWVAGRSKITVARRIYSRDVPSR